ncbi:hypothetical protein D9M68_883490 [compost metagenome]
MQAAAGEEAFIRTGGILALQRGLEHGRQAGVGVAAQVVDGPAAQVVLRGKLHGAQFGNAASGMALVQLGDHLQVGGQHPQFGGGAELQFAAFVDVEGLVGVVGLHPHPAAIGRTLEQGEAVAHLVGLLR